MAALISHRARSLGEFAAGAEPGRLRTNAPEPESCAGLLKEVNLRHKFLSKATHTKEKKNINTQEAATPRPLPLSKFRIPAT